MGDIIVSFIVVILKTLLMLAIILGVMHFIGWLVSWAEQHLVLFLIITIPTLALMIKQEIDKY